MIETRGRPITCTDYDCARVRAVYKVRRQFKRCGLCGRVATGAMCELCRAYHTAACADRYVRHRAGNVCTCCGVNRTSRARCDVCAQLRLQHASRTSLGRKKEYAREAKRRHARSIAELLRCAADVRLTIGHTASLIGWVHRKTIRVATTAMRAVRRETGSSDRRCWYLEAATRIENGWWPVR